MTNILRFLFVCSAPLCLVGCVATTHEPSAEKAHADSAAEVLARGPHSTRDQTNRVLLEWAKTHPEEGIVWVELHRRFELKRLTQAEASRAIDLIIDYMRKVKPEGYKSSLGHAQGHLIGDYTNKYGIDDRQLRALMDAYHGTKVKAFAPYPIYDNAVQSKFAVSFGADWGLPSDTGQPYKMFYQVTEVQIDGKSVEVSYPSHGQPYSAFLVESTNLALGEHTLAVKIEVGVTEWQKLRGFNASRASRDDWPETRLRWQVVEQTVFTVQKREVEAARD